MKRHTIGLVIFSLIATAWGQLRYSEERKELESKGVTNGLYTTACKYLSCLKDVASAEAALTSYTLSTNSVGQLTSQEYAYYQAERMKRGNKLQRAKETLEQLKSTLIEADWHAISILQNYRDEKRKRDEIEKELESRIQMLKMSEWRAELRQRRPHQKVKAIPSTEGGKEKQILEKENDLDSLRDAIIEFQESYGLKSYGLRSDQLRRPLRRGERELGWSESVIAREVSALEKQGFSNDVCVLAFNYLMCTQKVESAQKDLHDYQINEISLAQLTEEELDFYKTELSNRKHDLEELQAALDKVNSKLMPTVCAALPIARDIWNEKERLEEKGRELKRKAYEMRQKIYLLRKNQGTPKLIAEDLNGLTISNLVIRQVCEEYSSIDEFRVFSYSLTITDGRITKIEELPSERLRVEPVTPIVLEKNK